jgi:MFS family permease
MSYTVATLVFGYLSDKINKRYIILLGLIGLLFAAQPFIQSLKMGDPMHIMGMCVLLGALIGMTEGTLNPLVAESFPTHIRTTSVAFCWNFTAVAFGGVAPIVSMWLIENAGGVDAVAYYLMSVCTVSMVAVCLHLFRAKHAKYRLQMA